jgi:hypothetical protein
VNPSISVDTTTPGVVYTTEGEAVPGGTVVITATLEDGYAWGELPAGWVLVNATTATFTATFGVPTCATPTAPAEPTVPTTPAPVKTVEVSALPTTGQGDGGSTNPAMLLMVAAATILLGAAAGVAIQRKRTPRG